MISNSVFESCVQNLGFYSVKLRVPLRVALRSVALLFVLRCFALRVPLRVALRSVAWRFVLRCFALRVGLRVALRCVARRARNFHPESYKIRPGGSKITPNYDFRSILRPWETQHRPRRAKTKPQEAPGGQK